MFSRVDLYHSYGLRRIYRLDWSRDGRSKRIVGAYLRLPDRIYYLLFPSRFTVAKETP